MSLFSQVKDFERIKLYLLVYSISNIEPLNKHSFIIFEQMCYVGLKFSLLIVT